MSFIKDIFNRLCFDKIKSRNDEQDSISSDITDFKIKEKLIDQECIICLDEFNVGDKVTIIKCGHLYHSECLYTWLLKKPVCPLCDDELILK